MDRDWSPVRYSDGEPLSFTCRVVRSRLGLYAPLVLGQAILHGPDARSHRWRVHVSADGRLMPLGPRSAAAVAGRLRSLRAINAICRVGEAMLSTLDFTEDLCLLHPEPEADKSIECYGWSLLYQSQSAGVGLIDAHEEFTELPAFYESALELLDRAAFLDSKGVRSRAVAIVADETDIVVDSLGRRHNRFFPLEAGGRP